MKKLTLSGVNLVRWIGIIAVLSLLVSCSRFGDVVGPQSSDNTEAASGTFEPIIYDYPEAANYAPDGYQLISFKDDEIDGRMDDGNGGDYDTFWVCRQDRITYFGVASLISSSETETISWNRGSISIPPNALPSDAQWISMACQIPRQPWIDFGPHGLVFNEPVTIRISYADGVLPLGIMPEDLVLFYWNETTGEYELISLNNNPDGQYLEGQTDHFSRYIIAASG